MKIAEKLPQELLDDIRAHLTGDIVGNNAEIMQKVRDGISIQLHIDGIEAQMNTLFNNVNKSNKYFWPALVKLGLALTARPTSYSHRSYKELELKLQYSYEAWEETPRAIEWVRQKLKK
ncbi:hypothetical protein CB0940_08057 [Cercospora beticola]|uniref:Uncharacterized protein n=1 Tax=Cercospora beticola TaxID=122368 RepID=A0A2G5HQ81_CERBT|nr:hypothetical protein CB0940_08057 [Cercospora beticola]PIA94688.1 hypothetical protein CB0940_08057 [Cercospora beticola]WPB04615.1 hypothetical protein RHO25_009261 [Cercospora beticola]